MDTMMPLKFALCLTCLGLGRVGKLSLLNTAV